jgi:5'-phosphate synthase pdxT subunit
VRTAREVEGLDVLVLPGGESTTMLRLLEGSGIEEAVRAHIGRGGALFGTCAGLILLARRVVNPEQRSWGLLDVDVERNAYGRQVDSFEAVVEPDYRGVFIRAPRIRRVGPGVEVLARYEGEPVLVREGRVLAATFHPELTDDRRIHELALAVASGGRG